VYAWAKNRAALFSGQIQVARCALREIVLGSIRGQIKKSIAFDLFGVPRRVFKQFVNFQFDALNSAAASIWMSAPPQV
jgi:hypothetical protein